MTSWINEMGNSLINKCSNNILYIYIYIEENYVTTESNVMRITSQFTTPHAKLAWARDRLGLYILLF